MQLQLIEKFSVIRKCTRVLRMCRHCSPAPTPKRAWKLGNSPANCCRQVGDESLDYFWNDLNHFVVGPAKWWMGRVHQQRSVVRLVVAIKQLWMCTTRKMLTSSGAGKSNFSVWTTWFRQRYRPYGCISKLNTEMMVRWIIDTAKCWSVV